jgi:hypothetical protein
MIIFRKKSHMRVFQDGQFTQEGAKKESVKSKEYMSALVSSDALV